MASLAPSYGAPHPPAPVSTAETPPVHTVGIPWKSTPSSGLAALAQTEPPRWWAWLPDLAATSSPGSPIRLARIGPCDVNATPHTPVVSGRAPESRHSGDTTKPVSETSEIPRGNPVPPMRSRRPSPARAPEPPPHDPVPSCPSGGGGSGPRPQELRAPVLLPRLCRLQVSGRNRRNLPPPAALVSRLVIVSSYKVSAILQPPRSE